MSDGNQNFISVNSSQLLMEATQNHDIKMRTQS